MPSRSRLGLDQTGRRATYQAHWFETSICYRFWLRVFLHGVPESPVFSSGSPADPPLLSMLEVAQTQPQPFWVFCRRRPRFTSCRPRHHCKASGLSSWYGLGIFRGDKGAVEFNRKTKLSKRTWMSCIRNLHRIAHSLCRLGHESQRFSGRSAHRRGPTDGRSVVGSSNCLKTQSAADSSMGRRCA
jgi:hypothetical protein